MPTPAYPLPPSLPPLHLYRHLLREVTYLPPAFRTTIDSTLRKKFHKHRQNGLHTKKRLAKAMSSLRTLRAANSGDKSAMETLILKGFGRSGNRRRELMTHLVKSQGPSDTQALESLMDQETTKEATQRAGANSSNQQSRDSSSPERLVKTAKNAFFEKWDQAKLLQILQSQKQHQKITKGTTSWLGQSVKGTDPDQFVPKTNIWGNSPADILVRAKRANWWRRNAHKIMPPLGKGEWELLGRLSTGAQEHGEWQVPQRRVHASPESAAQSSSSTRWNWESYATAPTARVEQPKTMSRQRRTGQVDSGPYAGRMRSQQLSNRWFRRVYNRTWQLTPSMEQDPNTLQYSLTWGKATSKLPPPTKSQLSIFDGVDSQGNNVNKIPRKRNS